MAAPKAKGEDGRGGGKSTLAHEPRYVNCAGAYSRSLRSHLTPFFRIRFGFQTPGQRPNERNDANYTDDQDTHESPLGGDGGSLSPVPAYGAVTGTSRQTGRPLRYSQYQDPAVSVRD
jgi:hypothetical protein